MSDELAKSFGKLQPQNTQAEMAVISAIFDDKKAFARVLYMLSPEHFYQERNMVIFNICRKLFVSGKPIDMLIVAEELKREGKLDHVGGAKYLMDVADVVSSSANIEYHARMVVETAAKREMIRVCTHMTASAFMESSDVFDLIDELQAKLVSAAKNLFVKSSKTMAQLVPEVMAETEVNMSKKGGITGIPSGFQSIDSLTGGWQRGELIILAARPAMGKTAFAANLAINPFKISDMVVMVFSLEMADKSIAKRILSLEAGVKYSAMSKGNISTDQYWELTEAASKVSTEKIVIDDDTSPSILQIRSKAMNLKMEKGLDLVIVDYLQLARGEDRGKGNREQEISSISRGLKQLAKEIDVPVIALSQLSRNVEQRGGDKRPMLSDLRESGSIEQDADVVIFLHRPEYYGISQNEDGSSTKDMAEVIFAKHRNGALDTINLGCKLGINKFYDLTPMSDEIPPQPELVF